MPLYKRSEFVPKKPPPDLRPDEDVFFLKLTNEIFRDYDEYFDRMILCNSLVWSCSLTGKANLTFQEAVDSEKSAKKLLKGFPRDLKKALFYLVSLTCRSKVLDVCEDVFAYARERYFKNEPVLGVIGNMWCPSKVLRVIYPTKDEIEAYRKDQIEKGMYEQNDYLKDDSWGPPPDLFRYEVEETEPDNPDVYKVHILEAIDVKREKTFLTRDKSRYLMKLSTYYSEKDRKWRLKEEVIKAFGLNQTRFEDVFTGPQPKFEDTPGPPIREIEKKLAAKAKTPNNNEPNKKKSLSADSKPTTKKEGKTPIKKESNGETKKKRSKSEEPSKKTKSSNSTKGDQERKSVPNPSNSPSTPGGKKRGPKPKEKKPKEPEKEKEVEKKLTVQELKQIETERKAKEREDLKQQKKLIADFKKLWFKPKEDLEVEDLKDLPAPDPVSCSIPNHLFGDFVTVLEYFNCYANVLKVRDCFSSGLSFDQLERALVKNEIAGPFSDIVQLLLRAIFRLQESEHSEINQENTAGAELDVDEIAADVSTQEAITQATTAATWSQMYQNTPLNKLTLDHLSLTEVLRLHLLSSGAKPSEKDVKWRWQSRGCFDCEDDPGLILRLEEPQIIKTLTHGSVLDLTISEKLKVLLCLINQVLTFYDVREMMEDAMEQLKQTKMSLRSLQAAEKRKETEENLWKTRLRQDKLIPDMNALKELKELKAATDKDKVVGGEKTNSEEKPPQPDKPLLTDQEIEALIEKKDKEITKRKEEVDWKEAELMDAMLKHERKLGIHPVGRDRAYRRYWIFNTIPGIFVEQDDEFVGPCLSTPTPYLSDVNLNDVNFVKENFEKLMQVDREGSDKENSTLASPKKAPKKKQPSSKSKDAPPPRPEVYGICTGDAKLCPVHSKYSPHHKWSFYWSAEQLDQLIEGLTPRGIREKDLKQTLVDEKEGLVNLLKRCPVSKLNTDNVYPEHMLSIAERKQQRGGQSSKHLDPNLNYPEGTTLEEIQELQLRDLILEMEEKVFLGTLGSLKIKDRQAWRTAIEGRTYDMQTDAVHWGKDKDKSITKEDLEKLAKGSIKKLNSIKSNDDAGSSSGSSNTENRPNNESVPINPVIRDLACAILQFRQSLEAKFFKKPLGFGKDDGKNKGKAAIAENKTTDHINKGTSLSPIERWELSLMASTSFSQLFLHLFTLDNSIEWSRSVLNARCRVCRRKGDPDNMLLCDECNKGHHAYCLKPPLAVIPKGDWYCSDCRPPTPEPRQNRRARNKPLSREEILDELERDSEDEDEDEVRGSPRRRKARNTRASMDEDEDDEEDEDDVETCEMCGFGGKVICCDKCPKVYHLECLNPPMSRVPRGQWYCPKCSSSNNKTSKKKKSNSSKSKGSKKKVSRKNSSSEEESDIDDSQDSENDVVDDTNTEDDGINQDSNGSDNEGDEDNNKAMSGNESDEESDSDIPKVKVKIGNHLSKNARSTRSSRNRKYVSDSEDENESDEEQTGRGRKRKSASEANLRIRQVTKRLRSDSKENSESSNDSNSHSRKRTYESDSNGVGQDAPKRTRLQRMNTNQCTENGELDNVLLDRLLHDVMKHPEAWPFLKPVTKTEAPDYHEIVRYPMDLGTIKYKLNSMVYTCNEELISDLNLVFANCLQYNDPTHPVYKAGKNLRAFCERRLSKLSINFQDPSTSTSVNNTN